MKVVSTFRRRRYEWLIHRRRFRALWSARRAFVLSVFLSLASCRSSDLPLEPVTGKITHQGQPLERGTVVFTPQPGTPGPPAVGNIEPDGSYRMSTAGRDGAAVGKHTVTVNSRRELTLEESNNLVIPTSLIPEHYGQPDKTGLEFEVVAGAENVYDIPLE